MNNPIQINYWTIGGFDGAKPIAQAMAEAKAMGCDGLELTFGAGHFAPGISDAACRDIRREARTMGLRIETVATGGFWDQSLSDPRPAARRKALAFAREYLVRLGALAPGGVGRPRRGGRAVGRRSAGCSLWQGLETCHGLSAGTSAGGKANEGQIGH